MILPALLAHARRGALDFALPRVCVSCERLMSQRERGLVCGLCWGRLPLLPHPACDRCGHPEKNAKCDWCDLLPPYVRSARSLCWMPLAPAGQIVHALKYGGWHAVAGEMACRMTRLSWPEDVVRERAALVPVPLASSREKERGYNQSEALCAGLSAVWRIPVWSDCLIRTRSTRSQTELSPEDRHANVAGSVRFHSRQRAGFVGAHIVLVDDVVTTAATLNECARVLYDAGARIISYVTFGRARSAGDRI
jgi:ComF family protein